MVRYCSAVSASGEERARQSRTRCGRGGRGQVVRERLVVTSREEERERERRTLQRAVQRARRASSSCARSSPRSVTGPLTVKGAREDAKDALFAARDAREAVEEPRVLGEGRLVEVRVAKRLVGRDAALRVVGEEALEEVEARGGEVTEGCREGRVPAGMARERREGSESGREARGRSGRPRERESGDARLRSLDVERLGVGELAEPGPHLVGRAAEELKDLRVRDEVRSRCRRRRRRVRGGR